MRLNRRESYSVALTRAMMAERGALCPIYTTSSRRPAATAAVTAASRFLFLSSPFSTPATFRALSRQPLLLRSRSIAGTALASLARLAL